jgi:uncharacterized protein YjiS (DUF1127 family)
MSRKPQTRVGRFVAFLEKIENRRRERLAIETMDDHMLADIGLTREQLRRSIHDTARSGTRIPLPALARGAL